MKKFISLFISVILLLTGIPLTAAAATTGKYKVNTDICNVYESPGISMKTGELYKGDIIELTQLTGVYGYVSTGYGLKGWVALSSLTEINAVKCNISALTADKPSKLNYYEGDKPNLEGLKVYSVINGVKKELTGYTVSLPDISVSGKKTVTVSYTHDSCTEIHKTSFEIEVKKNIKNISVVTLPVKQGNAYIERQALDLTGLSVKIKYNNGDPDRIFTLPEILADNDFVINGCHGETNGTALSFGTHNIKISYKYVETPVMTVNVRRRSVTSLTLNTEPVSLVTYSVTSVPDISGLTLKATYDNGETEIISASLCEVRCDPSGFIIGKKNRVDIYYNDMFAATLYYDLKPLYVEGLFLEVPKTLMFTMGDVIDISSLKVYVVYSDGTKKLLPDGYNISRIDPLHVGEQEVVVSYNEYSARFPIDINLAFARGDLDGDAKVTAGDARTALRIAVGIVNVTSAKLNKAGDVDFDGKITASDARLILRAAVSLEDLYAKNIEVIY